MKRAVEANPHCLKAQLTAILRVMARSPGTQELSVSRRRAASFLREVLLPRLQAPAADTAQHSFPAAADYAVSPEPPAGRADAGAHTAASLVRELGLVQMDPVRIVERNHELVFYNRIDDYRPAHLEKALEERLVFEYICGNRSILPMDEYPYFVPFMKQREHARKDRLDTLGGAAGAVRSILEREGPLPSRAIESEEKVSGYWDAEEALRTKATTHALQLLWEFGRVVAAGRKNGEIVFDLRERAIPAHLLSEGERMTETAAADFLRTKYYRAYRLFDAGHPLFGFGRYKAAERRAMIEADAGNGILVPVKIENVKRQYYCLASDAERLASASELPEPAVERRAPSGGESGGEQPCSSALRILSPLDNFLWRRERLKDIFGFEYRWELYIPDAKRKYGPYTMPVLYGAGIPLRLDLKLDRGQNTLELRRLYWEDHLSSGNRDSVITRDRILHALNGELERLAAYLGASLQNTV